MEFKGLSESTNGEFPIAQKYSISNPEVVRARLGLTLLGRNDLLDDLPTLAGLEGSDTNWPRDIAEAVFVGNLALLQNISDPTQAGLEGAQRTVRTGLEALELGLALADIRHNEEFKNRNSTSTEM